MNTANKDDPEKVQRCQCQLDHLAHVNEERDFYRECVAASVEAANADDVKLTSRTRPVGLTSMHYSFDYAQQVHYPANPMQPGPIYFLTPRKCGIFGVNCEGVSQQINYLIDEADCIGKGSNAVISYIHHFFEKFGLQEQHVDIHCDNCSGQNKNKYMMWYFCWRVINTYHTSAAVHFMVPGHTKFAPDQCFGLLKQKFQRTEVNSMDDIVDVVDSSSSANISQVSGDVVCYNWQSFLGDYFRQVDGIKSLHHFR